MVYCSAGPKFLDRVYAPFGHIFSLIRNGEYQFAFTGDSFFGIYSLVYVYNHLDLFSNLETHFEIKKIRNITYRL